ncbi:MAG: type II secretion system F family protein [Planctomycetaceae bacterium]
MLIAFIALLFLGVPLMIAAIQLVVGRRHADQAAVLWTLAISLDKQLPLVEELDGVAGTLSKRHARKTRRLADGIRGGDSLSDALRWAPGVIPHAAILAAQVGEENDTFPTALRDAAIRHAKSGPGHGAGLSSMSLIYPIAVLLFTQLIFTGLIYFVVPKFKKIFEDFGFELPEFTQGILQAADLMNDYAILFLPIFVLPLVVAGWAVTAYCRGWGEVEVPLVGRWFRRLDVPGILRNLATTVAADRPLDDALLVLGREHRRKALRNALSRSHQKYCQGDDCWHALRDAGLLTAREVAALRSAQRVGNLPWALRQLAEAIERRLSHRWLTVLEVAQPVAVLGLGVIVGVIEIGFFAPLVSLIEKVN